MDTQNKQSKKKDNNDLLKVAAVIGLAYLFFKKGDKEIPNDDGTPIPDPLPMPLECPEGYYWGGSSCVEQIQHGLPIPDPMPPIPDPEEKPFECPPNSYWNGVDCIPLELPFECPPGTYLNEHGECVKKEQDAIDPECPDGYYMNESGHCIEIIQDHVAPRPEPDPISDLVKEITDPLNDSSLTVEPTCPDDFYWGGNSCVEMIQHQRPPEPLPPIPTPGGSDIKHDSDPYIQLSQEPISSLDTSPINRLSGLRGTIFDKMFFPQHGEPTLYYSEQDILNNERVKRYQIAESKIADRCQEFIGYDSEGLPVITKKVFY